MRKIYLTGLMAIFLIFSIIGYGKTNEPISKSKVPINRSFASLKLGMSGEEYAADGWHEKVDKKGKSLTTAYLDQLARTTYYYDDKQWEKQDLALEAKYPNELKWVHWLSCEFYNNKLVAIEIQWSESYESKWDAFSQKTIDKYGPPNKEGLESYEWDDGKTTLQIQKRTDFHPESGVAFVYDVATYTDNGLSSQLKQSEKEKAPQL